MPRDEFRERVLELVKLMAETGATGLGFPTEYGGGGDIGASIAAFETLGFGDLSILVKVGVQFGLFGGAILQLGSKHHHEAYLADLVTGGPAGLLRDDRDGPRFQRAGAGHRRGVRQRREGVRDHDSGRPLAQGLHRQRRRARVDGGGVRPARDPRRLRGRARVRRTDPGQEGEAASRRPHRGRRRQDRAQRGRQRTDLVRRRTCPAHQPAQPLRRRHRGRPLRLQHREQGPPVLHHARHPDPGTRLRRRRRDHGQQGGARRGDQVRATIAASSARRTPARRSCSSTTACTSVGCCRCSPRPTRCTSPRRSCWPSCTTSSRRTDAPDRQRRSLESLAAGTKALGTWHASRTIQECREACGGAGYLMSNRLGALRGGHRRVHDLRGRQPHPAPAGGQGAAHRLLLELRRPRPARDGALRRRAGRRDRARAHQCAQAARADQGRAARRQR